MGPCPRRHRKDAASFSGAANFAKAFVTPSGVATEAAATPWRPKVWADWPQGRGGIRRDVAVRLSESRLETWTASGSSKRLELK